MIQLFRALWAYRGFILGSVRREFQLKYSNSILGAAWNVLNPLAMIAVYTVIFSEVMRARLPGVDSSYAYSVYLCAGLLTWGLFAEIVGRGQTVFLDNANLLKKLSFPRMCLPVVIVCSAGLNFAIVFALFSLFLVVSGNFPGVVYLAVIPLTLILVAFSVGLGVTLGVLNVFFRDIAQFFGIFLTFWFWLTPIVYPMSTVPDSVRPFLSWNPMAGLIGAYQGVFVFGQWPQWQALCPAAIAAIAFCVVGLALFRQHAGEIVDEL
ncbi:ABC transporter permease [Niveibacterium sp. COAC-50]|uniref:ABC transporter permease n=1 Tax=Niveibacterium sp. COAC-50 TaxID=2729384 RepID=UPI001554CB47|nr:ABC transporter permease [Niveibacterium sp. COAC-50]